MGIEVPPVRCSPLVREPLTPEQSVQAAAVFKALADPVRLQLFSLIASHDGGQACVPVGIDPALLARVDKVITLGREAVVDAPGVNVINWDTDEPSERGIDGIERMRLVRDDITARIRALAADLTPEVTAQ